MATPACLPGLLGTLNGRRSPKPADRAERRLAAILAADMVGYSPLMAADEVGTLAALKAHRGELIDPTIAAHNARTSCNKLSRAWRAAGRRRTKFPGMNRPGRR